MKTLSAFRSCSCISLATFSAVSVEIGMPTKYSKSLQEPLFLRVLEALRGSWGAASRLSLWHLAIHPPQRQLASKTQSVLLTCLIILILCLLCLLTASFTSRPHKKKLCETLSLAFQLTQRLEVVPPQVLTAYL